ncbi:hypothetical protein [Deinococcus sp. YIM 77859]|uniref:hypothetical protein n=1 Tax=Deinococcus sp. YIM 77859 TaxID=1540221 RepID=UPI000AB947CD|nr:hypothetical protein [Deinococcus sp. YIM 77859]
MGITIDGRATTDALTRLLAACDDLSEVAERARAEALGHAILGARANIYNTTPGAYQRTQEYLRGLDAQGRAGRTTATVTVSNSTPYAPYVELGRTGLGYEALQALALAQPDPGSPLTLGRSGQRWFLPGPILTGAQAFALYRMRELFVEKVRGVL